MWSFLPLVENKILQRFLFSTERRKLHQIFYLLSIIYYFLSVIL